MVMSNIPFLEDEERDRDGLNSPKSVSTKTCWEPSSPLGLSFSLGAMQRILTWKGRAEWLFVPGVSWSAGLTTARFGVFVGWFCF